MSGCNSDLAVIAENGIRRGTARARLLGFDYKTFEKMDFSVEENGQEVLVNLRAYEAVADAVAEGRIGEGEVRAGRNGVPAQGEYDMHMNMIFTSVNSLLDRSVLVHEMTHAIIDMQNANRWTMATNESTAFYAQTLFLHFNQLPIPPQGAADPLHEDVFLKALALATASGMTSELSARRLNRYAAWGPLRAAVATYYRENGSWVQPDGKTLTGEENAGANGVPQNP